MIGHLQRHFLLQRIAPALNFSPCSHSVKKCLSKLEGCAAPGKPSVHISVVQPKQRYFGRCWNWYQKICGSHHPYKASFTCSPTNT